MYMSCYSLLNNKLRETIKVLMMKSMPLGISYNALAINLLSHFSPETFYLKTNETVFRGLLY